MGRKRRRTAIENLEFQIRKSLKKDLPEFGGIYRHNNQLFIELAYPVNIKPGGQMFGRHELQQAAGEPFVGPMGVEVLNDEDTGSWLIITA